MGLTVGLEKGDADGEEVTGRVLGLVVAAPVVVVVVVLVIGPDGGV